MNKGCILKKDKVLYLVRLSDMLKQGFTLMEAIQLLTDQFPQFSKQKLTTKVIELVKDTGQLHEVLKVLNYPQVIITQIYFGENYGNLIETIDHSILYLKKIEHVKERFIKTIQYPALLLCIFFMLLAAVNQTIIPQFSEIYESMNVEISTSLKVITTIFSYLPTTIFTIFLSLILINLLLYMNYMGKDVSKRIVFFKRIPFINKYISMYHSYRIARDFSFFIQNGVTLNTIIEIYMLQTKDDFLKYIGLSINNAMRKGETFPNAIKQLGCFDEHLIHYIKHGENKSKLDLELHYFSVFMLDKLEKTFVKHLKWIQPIVFGILALLIVTLYLIIILPMLQMVEGIK
ncbi:competence type IV pilus assembly protein ComGB [Mammaliicoccus vitulinus]|uniref:competence type IV pilus assembly protein ComGB n=1 Tax=Mammaliicoccus vitulinus TaxID=71237 RepID=UPI001AE02561|nr:competence type IV pilus assembly protein ComGB [Mammaliicoccus vitulinus]QTN11940.1 type II secretion system F family protein [Mammaliicoccus vitulinus]